jgi:hypothetical protein
MATSEMIETEAGIHAFEERKKLTNTAGIRRIAKRWYFP